VASNKPLDRAGMIGGVIFAAALIAIFADVPRTVTLSPEFDGTLTVDGRVAERAEVYVGFSGNHKDPCAGLSPAAWTDEYGRFHVPAATTRMTKKEVAAIPHGMTEVYVCFRHRDRLVVDSMFLVAPYGQVHYRGDCAIPRPVDATGEDAMTCWWRRTVPGTASR
jgi:hypothetical protein